MIMLNKINQTWEDKYHVLLTQNYVRVCVCLSVCMCMYRL